VGKSSWFHDRQGEQWSWWYIKWWNEF
jgi:hypothetical protein